MLKIVQRGGGLLNKIFPQNQDPYNAKTYQLGAVEITAPRKADANPTTTIVSKKDMENTFSQNFGEALRFTPGVFYMPGTTRSTLYMRGHSEDTIGFYLDGIPISDTYRSHASSYTDVTAFTTFGLAEIALSKGYVSPAFASYNLGGAINMVTSVPIKDFEFAFKYSFISNNENRLDTQVGRNFGDSYFQITYSQMDRSSLQYSYDYATDLSSESAYDIPNTRKMFRVLSGKYGWLIGDNHEYSVNFRYQKQKMNGGWNFINYDATTFYLLGNSRFNKWVSLDSRVYYHMNLNATLQSQIYDDYTTGLIENLKFDLTENQNLKVGVNLKLDSHRQVGYQVPNEYRNKHKVLNSTEFIEYAIRFNDIFRFVASGSYERQDPISLRAKKYADRRTEGAPVYDDRKLHLDGWSLQGILYANLGEHLLLHANVGRKSNIPNFSQFYSEYGEYASSPDLQTETAMNYEFGANFTYGSTQLGATGFYNDLNNMVITVRTDGTKCDTPSGSGASTYCYQYQNADVGYIYGGEAFVKQGLFNDKLVLGANWSYTQRKSYNYDNYGNRTTTTEFVTHPRQNINVSVLVAPRKEYDLSLSGSVQTSRYASVAVRDTATNTITGYDYVKIPTIVYMDLVANYYLKDNLKLSLGAYNLFDRNYNYSSSATSVYTGGLPGRRVFTSLEYRY